MSETDNAHAAHLQHVDEVLLELTEFGQMRLHVDAPLEHGPPRSELPRAETHRAHEPGDLRHEVGIPGNKVLWVR